MAKLVFVHHESDQAPRQQLYKGPYKENEPGTKTFNIDMGEKRRLSQLTDLSLCTWI